MGGENCDICEPRECPFCKQKTAYLIEVRGEIRLVCYRKGCHYEGAINSLEAERKDDEKIVYSIG